MLSTESRAEFRKSWLPNINIAGLDRLTELLERASPLLIHGCFTRAVPMGCLATHIAWNHPETCQLTIDAGINWLHHVAKLNPATSLVLREWDQRGPRDLELRGDLLREVRREKRRRARATKSARVAQTPVAV